mmetsp:Transcript_46732/g.99997  ORF Transcript_46732/g.99997 Transcript_46732/m.99997 type:complete len:502 (-) Transcript_46732:130-1635(-)
MIRPSTRCSGLGQLVLLLSSLLLPACQAEIYTFSSWQVPPAGGLQALHAFYVFAPKDLRKGQIAPTLTFDKLVAMPSDKSPEALEAFKRSEAEGYRGLQVHVMKWEDYSAYVKFGKHCSKPDAEHPNRKVNVWLSLPADVKFGDVSLFSATVRLNNTEEVTRPSVLDATGVWVMFVTNCGEFERAKISGEVAIKSSYGYLPGSELHKRTIRYALLVGYLVVGLFWAYQCTQRQQEVGPLHHCISTLLMIGFAECLLWFWFYYSWNVDGVKHNGVLGCASTLSVMKTIALSSLLPALARGWYITTADVTEEVLWRIKLLAICYLVTDSAWQITLHFRSRESMTMVTLVLAFVPVYAQHAGVFAWVYRLLSETRRTLQDRGQTDMCFIFATFQRVLVAAIVLVSLALCGELLVAQDSVHRWRFHWLAADGITQPLFLVVLVVLMLLWGPGSVNKSSILTEESKDVIAEDQPLVGGASDEEDEETGGSPAVLAPTKLGAAAALE